MNQSICLCALAVPGLFLAMATVNAQSDLSLEPRDVSRFETIWIKSPFVALTDLSGQVDDLAGRFVLTGFARMGKQDVIFLFDRTSLERFKLTPGETRHGLALQSLQHEGNLQSARATVLSGGRTLDITYDPAQHPAGGQPMQAGTMPFMQGHLGHPGHPDYVHPGHPGHPGLPMQQGQQAMPQNNPNQIVGAAPDTGEPPPPRRVIRRRAIVAPE